MLQFHIQVLNGWYDSYNINTKLGELNESIRRSRGEGKKEEKKKN